tara:strand:+ start:1318 stop:1515 length:198 start_codon:yes stop_codon:yes gene_type:complete
MDQDSSIDLNYEQPYLRAKVASYEREVANLKADNAELTKSLYKAYERIKELSEAPKTISGNEKSW